MSKFNQTHEAVDLDKAFRSLRSRRTMDKAMAKGEVIKDPANIMDNWLATSNELRAQANSQKQSERDAWAARNALDAPVPRKVLNKTSGKRAKTKQWFTDPIRKKRLTRSSSKDQTMTDSPATTNPNDDTYWIFREFWIGDRTAYIDKIYQTFGKGSPEPIIPEEVIWRIFEYLIDGFAPNIKGQNSSQIIAEPNTIWQVGKGVLQILTHGRYWDLEANVLSPVDGGVKFGVFKQNILQKRYSKALMKEILGCLTTHEKARPTIGELKEQFNKVFLVYDKTFRLEHENLSLFEPYRSKDPRVPVGLDKEEVLAYETLLDISNKRPLEYRPPRIIVITDLAKDYDDLTAMMILKELNRLGFVELVGFVANLEPADRRAKFGRGALDALKLVNVPIAAGTKGEEDEDRHHDVQSYEFAGAETFMKQDSTGIFEGQAFLLEKLMEAARTGQKLTLLAISSLLDIGTFCDSHPDEVRNGLEKVIFQGGYYVENGVLKPDFAATNNKFAQKAATKFHEFLSDNRIPSTAYTKVATFATPIDNSLFLSLEATRNPIGVYLRQCQLGQDLAFYTKACNEDPKQRFAPFMDQAWYLKNKSAWAATGHEPDEPGPVGPEVVKYLTSVTAYDALAALGTAGDKALEALGIPKKLVKRPEMDHSLHKIVGVPLDKAQGLPEEVNLDGEKMAVAIYALLKGSLLAVEQGLS